MFCKKCGKQIADNIAFCTECGAPVAQAAPPVQPVQPVQPVYTQPPVQPVYTQPPVQPVQPVYAQPPVQQPAYATAEPSPFVRDSIAYIKGFFSPKMIETTGFAAKSNGLQWIAFCVLNVLLLGISDVMGIIFNGGSLYLPYVLLMILKAVISFGVLTVGYFLLPQIAFKKMITFPQALNLIAYTTIPVTVATTANLVLSVYAPLATAVMATGAIIALFLTYFEYKKLATNEFSAFFSFVILVIILIAINTITDNLFGNILSSFFGRLSFFY